MGKWIFFKLPKTLKKMWYTRHVKDAFYSIKLIWNKVFKNLFINYFSFWNI